VPTLSSEPTSSLEAQVQQHLVSQPEAPPLVRPALGPLAALAPAALIDPARVAEQAFSAGDFEGCVRTGLEVLQRGLAFAGDASLAHQAYLLGVSGRDVLDAFTRSQRGAATIDDGSFVLYVLAQLFVRLSQAGLPTPEQ
jgi:hypothetical protein